MHSDNHMTPRAWFARTIGLTALLVLTIASVNAGIDLYGIFRDSRGRHIAGYGDDRVAKYLLSERYVPSNFNALVIGSSVSANWDTSRIDSYNFYNESLDGGNIVEEKTICDRALISPRIKLVLLVVHPFLTSSHDFETIHVSPRENVGALGSQYLLDAYKDKLRGYGHNKTQTFDESGVFVLRDTHREMNAVLRKVMDPVSGFKVDPIALQAEHDVVAELHAAKIAVVFVIPPISQKLLSSRSAQLAAYSDVILRDKTSSDNVLDFTASEFVEFRKNEENFSDGVHLTTAGAASVVGLINRHLNSWIQTGQLPAAKK